MAGVTVGLVLLVGLAAGAGASPPPPGFELQETITVPTDGRAITSSTSLVAGRTYRLRASGVFNVGSPCPLGDAEYANFDSAGTGCPLQDITTVDGTDLGIGINSPLGTAKITRWGPYNPAHVYESDLAGQGSSISLNYHDCRGCYGDNRGALTVEIFSPKRVLPVIPVITLIALALVLLVLGVVLLRN